MNSTETIINSFAINSQELLQQCNISQSLHILPFLNDNNSINAMSTYNALRMLYREAYDLRSNGKVIDINKPDELVGRETNPITNLEMKVNYLNDFSISAITSNNNFIDSICGIYPYALKQFSNEGLYKDLPGTRNKVFLIRENSKKTTKEYTCDFFSNTIQVNPLLYAYAINDENDSMHVMDADYFLEHNLYKTYFNNESFIMKGNQYCIPLWKVVTDTTSHYKNIEDDDGIVIGSTQEFQNQEFLFKDSYTNELLYILQNPKRFYKFRKQNDFTNDVNELTIQDIRKESLKDVVTEEESRGHLFYDLLLELVLKRLDNDGNEMITIIKNLINNIVLRNRMEFDGFPIDQYMSRNDYQQYDSNIQKDIDAALQKIGDNNTTKYRLEYYKVFVELFRRLPYLMSPQYTFDILSPAMSIMYMAFTIIAIKYSYYHNKEDYDDIVINLLKAIDDATITFEDIFSKEFFKRNLIRHLEVILPILIKNSSAINYNETDNKSDIDTYFSDKLNCYVETKDTSKTSKNQEEESYTISKAIILLTEFFTKCESLRYFDASTFAIDYTQINNNDVKYSLKLFADALMESCYIHMNILGSESFLNGSAPIHPFTNSFINDNRELISLDITRVAKRNIELLDNVVKNNSYRTNSYHSYMPVINLYISLSYCINITVDNISSNLYNVGPYSNSNIRRSHAVWVILKRYALHMTYINNNSYGIYNQVSIGSNDKEIAQKIMVSQRVKWLTYGLHMRVWFNDGYYFYTNYKKLMMNYNGDVQRSITALIELYNNHVNGITEPLPLFRNLCAQPIIPTPNLGLSLAPLAGSYTITSNAYMILYYMHGSTFLNHYIINLLHHGFKDIMVGDSLSSILNERFDGVVSMINIEGISYNNINGRLQKVFNRITTSKYHEIAIAANLEYLYRNIIRKHFIDNSNDCLILNGVSNNSTYDVEFFKNHDCIASYPIAYQHTWCYRIFERILKSNNKNNYMRLISRIINLYRVASCNYKLWHAHNNKDKRIEDYYYKFYGFSNMFVQFINNYSNSIDKIFEEGDQYGIFGEIIKTLYCGINSNRYAIGNSITINDSLFSFEDLVVCNTAGGSIYAMYESPIALLIYNNLDFNFSYILPSLESLYNLTKVVYAQIYLTVKKLLTDISNNNNFAITNKYKYIMESLELFNTSTNDSIEHQSLIFRDIIDKGNIYKFITVIAQFMDYDYICANICQILDNQYDINDGKKFMQNSCNNRREDLAYYINYCNVIDSINNQLNYNIKQQSSSKKASNITKKQSITIIADNKYGVVLPSINNNDNSITFYTGDAKNSITINIDYNPSITLEEYWKNNHYHDNIERPFGVNVDIVNDLHVICNVTNNVVTYDKYYYIPYKYLLKVIPYTGRNNSVIDNSNNDNISSIDICKALKQQVPLYVVDSANLVIPFDNIPISFMQSFEKIIEDIDKRILPMNQLLAQDLMSLLLNRDIMKSWNKDMLLSDRIDILYSINNISEKKFRNDHYMKVF